MNSLNIKFLNNLSKDSYINYNRSISFCVFNSINNILYLIYSKENKSIIALDMYNNQIINEIKRAHKYYIHTLIHFLDEINNRDLIISIDEKQNNIKLWDIKNFECFLIIKNIYANENILACFLKENNSNYIITSKTNIGADKESIKVYDFNGKKRKTINYSNEMTFYIESYFDKKIMKNYIITCNKGHIISYDFKENKKYHIYKDSNNTEIHNCSLIDNNGKIIKLIGSCNVENIRIWNFHSGELLNKIRVQTKNFIFSICLYDSTILFVGCEDNSIKIINLQKKEILNVLKCHNEKVCSIKIIKHPKYGNFLISQGFLNDGIKLWFIDN